MAGRAGFAKISAAHGPPLAISFGGLLLFAAIQHYLVPAHLFRPVMDMVKDKIVEIATQTMNSDAYELRVGYVAYRDFDIEPGAEFRPFTYDLKAFQSSVAAIKAHSDIPPGKGQVRGA
eukprot:1145307-Pelagomonas_calceolata.AAC.3